MGFFMAMFFGFLYGYNASINIAFAVGMLIAGNVQAFPFIFVFNRSIESETNHHVTTIRKVSHREMGQTNVVVFDAKSFSNAGRDADVK